MKLLKSAALFLLPATLSASANAEYLINLADFPDWFQQSMARETSVETSGKMVIERLNVDAQVKGKPVLQDSGSTDVWYYTMDIGSDSPVECYAFLEFDGAANSLHAIVEHSLGGAEQINGKALSGRFTLGLDMGMVGDTPYLQLDTLYNLGEGGEKVAGVLKGLSGQTEQSLQICVHNEMGYQQAFFDVFSSFVQAFTANDQQPELYEATYRMTINGIPVGYSQEKHTIDQDGDIATVLRDAMITPVDQVAVSRSDSQTLEWSRPDGSLINAREYTIENGQLASQFAISSAEDAWQVTGQMQGKEVSATLEYNSWLLSSFGNYTETALLLASDAPSADYHIWLSDADPTSALPVTFTKIDELPDANLQFDLGPLTLKYLATENGSFEKGSIAQGGAVLILEKVYSKGQPVMP